MCIRDRFRIDSGTTTRVSARSSLQPVAGVAELPLGAPASSVAEPVGGASESEAHAQHEDEPPAEAVSYTHLTLPTICSV
eukprot:6525256-Alexandrium_andersonii.AAC.1